MPWEIAEVGGEVKASSLPRWASRWWHGHTLVPRLSASEGRTGRIVLGGSEVTADNDWVLATDGYDFAVIDEGEQTFSLLLLGLVEDKPVPAVSIPGLYVPPAVGPRFYPARSPAFRTPIPAAEPSGRVCRAAR
jgi:hypothetical protein